MRLSRWTDSPTSCCPSTSPWTTLMTCTVRPTTTCSPLMALWHYMCSGSLTTTFCRTIATTPSTGSSSVRTSSSHSPFRERRRPPWPTTTSGAPRLWTSPTLQSTDNTRILSGQHILTAWPSCLDTSELLLWWRSYWKLSKVSSRETFSSLPRL